MEDWPPELAQCVFYAGWCGPEDIVSLCYASQIMSELLLGDEHARAQLKSFAGVGLLVADNEHRALYYAFLHGRVPIDVCDVLLPVAGSTPFLPLTKKIVELSSYKERIRPRTMEHFVPNRENFEILCDYVDFTQEGVRLNAMSACARLGEYERLVALGDVYGYEQTMPSGENFWLIHYASMGNSVECVKLFLHQGFDRSRLTPFFCACESEHWEVFSFFLTICEPKYLMQQFYVKGKPRNALYVCMSSQYSSYVCDKVNALLETGLFDVNEESVHNPLYTACALGCYDVVKYLVSRPDVDVNLTINGLNPLRHVCGLKNERPDVVACFLERDDLDLEQVYVYDAVMAENTVTFNMLLKHPGMCLNPEWLNRAFVPRLYAYFFITFAEYTGFDINGTCKDGEPLRFACLWDNVRVVRYILAQPNVILHKDLNSNHKAIRQLLIEVGWKPPRKRHSIMSYYDRRRLSSKYSSRH